MKTYAALVATMVFWGLSFVATKVALESVPTFTLVFIRFSLAALFFLFIRRGRKWPAFHGKDRLKMVLLALFEPGLYFIFETIGLQHTTAPKTALIIATVPLVVLLLSTVMLGERTNRIVAIGIGLSFCGIALLVVGDPEFGLTLEGSLLGDLLIGGAVVSAALYMVFARDLGRSYSSLEITFVQIVYGAAFYSLFFLWELPSIEWTTITLKSALAVGYLTVFATVGAFLCYNFALSQVPASKAAVFVNGIPVVTAIGAWLLLDERLTAIQAGGGALVLAAVFLTNLPARKNGCGGRLSPVRK
ncbi:DMT family transporter [uncultured Desulfosarcina sp.]|uniref:DMT family transporter n=1 Tax=uncultured Desulfosarcina sp. TaxID=218289 RepID=UPI0029C74D97|nr:DMT family transporter [uncultured Desulfosarcina sp.]